MSNQNESNKTSLLRKKLSTIFLLVVYLSILITSGCSKSVDAPVTPPDLDPKGYYGIDVKTTFIDKYTATGVKNGHIAYMNTKGAKWSVVKEIGEDYSFWIRNVKTIPTKDSTFIRFDLELRTPAMITDGELIEARRGYVIVYPNSTDFDKEGNADAQQIAAFVDYTLKRNITVSKAAINFAAQMGGAGDISLILNVLQSLFFNDSKLKRSQIEGVLVGIVSFSEMRDMLKNLEKK